MYLHNKPLAIFLSCKFSAYWIKIALNSFVDALTQLRVEIIVRSNFLPTLQSVKDSSLAISPFWLNNFIALLLHRFPFLFSASRSINSKTSKHFNGSAVCFHLITKNYIFILQFGDCSSLIWTDFRKIVNFYQRFLPECLKIFPISQFSIKIEPTLPHNVAYIIFKRAQNQFPQLHRMNSFFKCLAWRIRKISFDFRRLESSANHFRQSDDWVQLMRDFCT